MASLQLPPQLEYLERFFVDSTEIYRSAEWLISDFDAPVWEYNFGQKTNIFLDWGITLEDGQSLLHDKHKDLLEGLRQYLVLSTRNVSDHYSETNALESQRSSFYLTTHIIDHLILNTKHYELARYGLAGLNRNHFAGILKKIADSSGLDEFLDWEVMVGDFSKKLIASTSPQVLEDILALHPELSIVTPEQEDDNLLGMPTVDIRYARAALHHHGYMNKSTSGWRVKVRKLTPVIYARSLFAKQGARRAIDTLDIAGDEVKYQREYPAVRVSTYDRSLVSSDRFGDYQAALYRMGALHETGVPAPNIPDLRGILLYEPEMAQSGRFRTLPSSIALRSVKQAIEFHIDHGDHLISSFCSLALHCVRKGKDPEACGGQELARIIKPETLAMGVRQVSLVSRITKRDKKQFFQDLRSNRSLLELIRVYIGSTQLVVGALMARRAGELIDLKALRCLDESEQWLLFSNRKSTSETFGIRNLEARPIEPIAVKMIKNLVRLQKVLKRIGYIKEITSLFASPCASGTRKFSVCTTTLFNRNLDLFCDYFQTDFNADGERYYIRQHQLRRFFAMLFFHTCSFGGLETLQWMLVHTNRRHVWNYITESQGGASLVGAKAQYIAEQLHTHGTQSYENLAKLLQDRYGAEDFALVDVDELEDEITELMKEGRVEIEPEFFQDERGEQMRILVKVRQLRA